MSTAKILTKCAGLVLVLSAFLCGCETSDETEVSGNVYYGADFHDPWYYGVYDYPRDVIVTPPPISARPIRPVQPIYNPPARPATLPSIPMAPRPAFRR